MQKDYIGTEKCGSDTPKNTGETLYLGSTSSESFKRRDGQNFAVYIIVGDDVLSPTIIRFLACFHQYCLVANRFFKYHLIPTYTPCKSTKSNRRFTERVFLIVSPK